ncbi:hypothetical protein ABOM_000010, partial [Aspergillus bombycis]
DLMATSNVKPKFVFVPGAWHTPDTFDIIRDVLAKRGFESEAIANRSVGAADPSTGLHADTAYTKSILSNLADQGWQIVMAGLPGGVVQMVWMAAFVAPMGKSVIDMLGGEWLPWMILKDPDDGYCYSSQQECVFYHDLTPQAQQDAISKLQPHPKPSFLEKAKYEPWHKMPSFYLFCDHDKGLPLRSQEAFSQTLGTPGTYHVEGSHSAFISVPHQVADGLELALKEGLEKSGIVTH